MEPGDLEGALAAVHPQSFGWALRCCRGDRIEAEDVLQQAYAKVLAGEARFEGRSAFKTWLFGVIRRTALELGRRRFVERIRLGRWLRERVEDSEPAADERVAREEGDRRIGAALARLSARQREILHLVFYQDLTIQEAAAVLGIPVGTARTHYERGKARLRARLGDREGAE